MKKLAAAFIIAGAVMIAPSTAYASSSPAPNPDIPVAPEELSETPIANPDVPAEIIEKYGGILGKTEDGNYYVQDAEGNILLVDEHGNVLGVVRSKTGRTSPKTGEFPLAAGLSAMVILSAAGIALTLKKENN